MNEKCAAAEPLFFAEPLRENGKVRRRKKIMKLTFKGFAFMSLQTLVASFMLRILDVINQFDKYIECV
jgi:hypothetical protein